MKTVKQRIKHEIEYLQALAEMYEHDSNIVARDAALNAARSLKALSDTINESTDYRAKDLPRAA